ncbi:MAG: ribosomal L7Ae/L30e/S12e/Gadd45 family protein [Clostridia bacterium]|nr:ribosomal L7Ae/L30e/S12e/Gadd45 family protein [Clostridia bacterium]
MMNRALSNMGLARRAGKLNWGYDTAVEAMKNGDVCLALTAADLSEKTKKNVRFEAEKYNVPFVDTVFSMEEISAAIGKKTGVVVICDAGFAKKLMQELGAAGEREELRI